MFLWHVFRALFQHLLEVFCRFFCCAGSSRVFNHNHTYFAFLLQRTRLFRIRTYTHREQGRTRGEQGYILRRSGKLLCGYLHGCRGEAGNPEQECVVVKSSG